MKLLSILFALILLPFLCHAQQIEVKEVNGKTCIVQTQVIETDVATIDRKIADVEIKINETIAGLNSLNNDKAALVEIRKQVKALDDARAKQEAEKEGGKKEEKEPPKRE
jgi:hypothetical protein